MADFKSYVDLFYEDSIFHRVIYTLYEIEDAYDDLAKFINDKGEQALLMAYEIRTKQVEKLSYEIPEIKRKNILKEGRYITYAREEINRLFEARKEEKLKEKVKKLKEE